MKVTELVEQLRRKDPKLLEGIPEATATTLIRTVFKHINETVAATKEGTVDYSGLGRFVVRKVEREKEGKKISRTQIRFRAKGRDSKKQSRRTKS